MFRLLVPRLPLSRLLALLMAGACLAVWPGCGTADPDAALRDLYEAAWRFRLDEDPLLATSVGVHTHNDRLPSMTPEALARREAYWQDVLARLDALDVDALSRTGRINYAIFRDQVEDALAQYRFGAYRIPLNADSGFHTAFARLPAQVPLATVADYDAYLARLRAFLAYVDQHIALMREGLATGMTLPRVVLDGIDVTWTTHLVDDVEESVFWAPFAAFPAAVPPSEQVRLRAEGRAAIEEAVQEGYRRFGRFMTDEYIPGARPTIAASDLPDGRAYYEQRVRHFTTLDLTPEEIHRIGLEEVARIRAEMEAVIEQVGFEGDFAAFLRFLRTDPRFYAETPEALLKEAAYIAKRMDGRLPALFGTLPRLPYGIAPVPDHLAPKYTAGRYVGPAWGSTEPGYYWVNTYDLPSRPLYTLEALTLHEAVPGHHLQIALSRELEDLPDFRRFSYISAFGEGWGLYAEWLGLETGFYTDPYSNFGRLTYEMWRACRLVVDTGMHALGWTRAQAMDFLASNTALSLHEVRTETDRYISWPGQALAYKMGEITIRRLRREAEDALGERFDVRAFHDVVLRNGSVPLPVLEAEVRAYIAASGG
ncbi:hypothetical protein AWN76_010425 [Rhodothermaceae bacterium RA]|nr:hypothetical protein AWN76_010425 [Rhodothermaceae bacterium RA]